MALKLYGAPQLICTRRVLLTAAELGETINMEIVDIMKGEQKSPEFLKKQPFGQVPALDDDGFMIFESRAISRYLATVKFPKKGASLIPDASKDPKGYARFEQAASIEMSNIEPYISVIVTQKVFSPAFGRPIEEEKLAAAKTTLGEKLDVLNTILATQDWVAGDHLTLVDLFYVPWTNMLGVCGEMGSINERPFVKAWWDRLSARESVKKVLQGQLNL